MYDNQPNPFLDVGTLSKVCAIGSTLAVAVWVIIRLAPHDAFTTSVIAVLATIIDPVLATTVLIAWAGVGLAHLMENR
jgi:hypothetical protein